MAALDYCLLGLIEQGDCSGYDIRKILTQTPMRRYSDSPGSIYPALARLERCKLIRSTRDSKNTRGRRCYHLTAKGRAILDQWLRPPPGELEIANQLPELMLRLSFQHLAAGSSASGLRIFLRALALGAKKHATRLRKYIRTSTAHYPLGALLALRAGLNTYLSLTRWAQQEARKIRAPRQTAVTPGGRK